MTSSLACSLTALPLDYLSKMAISTFRTLPVIHSGVHEDTSVYLAAASLLQAQQDQKYLLESFSPQPTRISPHLPNSLVMQSSSLVRYHFLIEPHHLP